MEYSTVPHDDSVPDTLESVLRKYGKIWIWSILSATVAPLAMRTLSGLSIVTTAVPAFGARAQFGFSFLTISLTAIVPPACTVVAVYYLLLFLRHHIVPILFPPSSDELTDESPALPVSRSDGGSLLWHAFAAIVFAVAAETGLALLSVVYRTVAWLN